MGEKIWKSAKISQTFSTRATRAIIAWGNNDFLKKYISLLTKLLMFQNMLISLSRIFRSHKHYEQTIHCKNLTKVAIQSWDYCPSPSVNIPEINVFINYLLYKCYRVDIYIFGTHCIYVSSLVSCDSGFSTFYH